MLYCPTPTDVLSDSTILVLPYYLPKGCTLDSDNLKTLGSSYDPGPGLSVTF